MPLSFCINDVFLTKFYFILFYFILFIFVFNDAISCDLRCHFIIIIFTRECINFGMYDLDGRWLKYECEVGMEWHLEGKPEVILDKSTLSTTSRM
jgi:hypothetical protein